MATLDRSRGGGGGRPGDRLLAGASILVYGFLYLPLAVVVLYSFGSSKIARWPVPGWTLGWYRELLHDREIRDGLMLSIRVGLTAAAIAIVLGTMAALAIDRFGFPGKSLLRFCIVLPITLPGVVTGVALLSFFSLVGWPLSVWTITIAHATFCITLILNNVVARLGQISRSLEEASADLGATPLQTFRRVTLPLILPAIVSGGVLAFTLSFDEIVVSLFLKGREATLPLVIWGRFRQGFSPEINAAATVIITVSLAGVLLSSRLVRRGGFA